MFEKWAGPDFEFSERMFELMIQTYTEEFLNFVSSTNRPNASTVCTAVASSDPNGDLQRLAELTHSVKVIRNEIKVEGFDPVQISWRKVRFELDCELNFGNFIFI